MINIRVNPQTTDVYTIQGEGTIILTLTGNQAWMFVENLTDTEILNLILFAWGRALKRAQGHEQQEAH